MKSALSPYASEIRPIVEELDRLREQATAFRAEIGDSDRWLKDQGKVDRNRHLIQAVAAAQEKFHAAERTAFNKITGLFDKSLALVVDDGSHKKGMYGYKPSDAAKATKTPWGEVEAREYEGAEAAWHTVSNFATGFVKGFVIDGTYAGARGLATLFGWDGKDKAGEAWGKLGDTVTGVGIYTAKPFDWAMDSMGMKDKDSADEVRAKKAAREFGKAFVAYDEWQKNPGRALGAVSFNAITITSGAFLKAGAVGKTGLGSKAATTLGKVGLFADPVTYVSKATGLGVEATKFAATRVGDLASELKNLVRPTDHTPNSVKLPMPNGTTRYLDLDGTIRRSRHEVEQPGTQALKEPSKHELARTSQEHRVHVHAGGGTDNAAHSIDGRAGGAASQMVSRVSEGAPSTAARSTDGPADGTGIGSHGSGTHTPATDHGHGASAHPGHDTPGTGSSGHGADGHPAGGHGHAHSGSHGDDVGRHADDAGHHGHEVEDGHRGTGDAMPAPEDVKQAIMNLRPQMIEKARYTPEDGHYYATRVFKGGRPDGETVFAGHGYLRRGSGEMTVPPGTTISFYVPHADMLPGPNGLTVEAGIYPGGYVETFHPGQRIPDYTLDAPAAGMGGGFSVFEKSTTVRAMRHASRGLGC
ncbi:putative adhesin [Streptomyces sp. NPDC046261]|uniref:putative adhesin n=1 Tax=Streptomyces sp. NPDC046261 TaxID=3157200 RepID=UPI0033DEB309